MDRVTAAKLRIDLELSASAKGPTATTSTTGTVAIARGTGVRVRVNPSAPAQARYELVGVVDLEVGIATGKAQASGASDAQCTATPNIVGADYTLLNESQTYTALTATCSCTALAIGVLGQ
jgi:hypothetical protein